jgi:hypothetical protein
MNLEKMVIEGNRATGGKRKVSALDRIEKWEIGSLGSPVRYFKHLYQRGEDYLDEPTAHEKKLMTRKRRAGRIALRTGYIAGMCLAAVVACAVVLGVGYGILMGLAWAISFGVGMLPFVGVLASGWGILSSATILCMIFAAVFWEMIRS